MRAGVNLRDVTKERIVRRRPVNVASMLSRFVERIRRDEIAAVQIGAENEILFENPFHHGDRLGLPAIEKIADRSVRPTLQRRVLRREISIQIDMYVVASASQTETIARAFGRIGETVLTRIDLRENSLFRRFDLLDSSRA